MAATVVSVVIFLCGVLVGRGVRPVSVESSPVAASESVIADAAGPPPASATQPATTEPPPTPSELSYYDRLERNTAPAETLKPAAGTPKSPAGARAQSPPVAADAEPP